MKFPVRASYALVVGLCSSLATCEGNELWDGPAFSADPKELSAAVAKLEKPEDVSAEVLLDEAVYDIDEQGRRTITHHQVYRILDQAGVDQWAVVSAEWAPWHQDRPTLKARVVTQDGQPFELQPGSISEAPVARNSPTVFTDARILEAPLPAIAIGCIVETQTLIREHRAFFRQGVVGRKMLVGFAPIRKSRLVVNAPVSIPLRYKVLGMELEPTRTEAADNVRLVFEHGPIPQFKSYESFLPRNIPAFPSIVFSTGKSWSAIAKAYAEIVEERIVNAEVTELVRQAGIEEKPREEVVQRCLAQLQSVVRYTGVEFGQASIVPNSPETTLSRRYGDCKDQSALLIAMLRKAGLQADAVLLNTSMSRRTFRELPGLNSFNHVIVRVAGDPAIWVDPTMQSLPAGKLPLVDQERNALVANSATERLTMTPRSSSVDNRRVTLHKIEMALGRKTVLKLRHEYHGSVAEPIRSYYINAGRVQVRKSWEERSGEAFGGRLLSLDYPNPKDFSQPFHVEARFEGQVNTFVAARDALVWLYPGRILDRLPYVLLAVPNESSDAKEDEMERREHPLHLTERYQYKVTNRIVPLPGYVVRELPEDETILIGPLALRTAFSTTNEGVVVAEFSFDTGHGQLTLDELRQWQKAYAKLIASSDDGNWKIEIAFDNTAINELTTGDPRVGLAHFRRLAESDASVVEARLLYIDALRTLGLFHAAKREGERLVEERPDSSDAWMDLGVTLICDQYARQFEPGYDRDAAEAAYKRAIELDAENADAHINFAIVQEYDRFSNRYGNQDRLNVAVQHYRRALELDPQRELTRHALVLSLFYLDRFAEAERDARKLVNPAQRAVLSLASIACRQGVEAFRLGLRGVDDPAVIRFAAAEMVANSRRYELSRQMLSDISPLEKNYAQAINARRIYEKIKKSEDVIVDQDDPRWPVQQLLMNVFKGTTQTDECAALFVDDRSAQAGLRHIPTRIRSVTRTSRRRNTPPQRIADAISVCEFEVKGSDENGHMVRVSGVGGDARWFVVKQDQRYLIHDLGPGHSQLGRWAWEAVRADKLATASFYLKHASELQRPGMKLFNMFSGSPFVRYWATAKRQDPNQVHAAAALLCVEGNLLPQEAIAMLEQLRQTTEPKLIRLQLDRGLLRGYLNSDRWQEAESLARRLMSEHPNQAEPRLLLQDAYLGSQQFDKLHQFGHQQLKKQESDIVALRLLASLAASGKRYDQADEYGRRLLATGKGTSHDYNQVAWNDVVRNDVTEQTLEDSVESNERTGYSSWFDLHTLATVHAELGQLRNARQRLLQTVDLMRPGDTHTQNMYVLGRIAEGYELFDSARELYKMVPADDRVTSTYVLAKRRLDRLNER